MPRISSVFGVLYGDSRLGALATALTVAAPFAVGAVLFAGSPGAFVALGIASLGLLMVTHLMMAWRVLTEGGLVELLFFWHWYRLWLFRSDNDGRLKGLVVGSGVGVISVAIMYAAMPPEARDEANARVEQLRAEITGQPATPEPASTTSPAASPSD